MSRSVKGRKPRVSVDMEDVRRFVGTHGIVTERQVCEGLDISQTNARTKLEAGVKRGWFLVDDHDAEGYAIRLREDWRYCVVD